VLTVFWFAVILGTPGLAVVVTGATYGFLRIGSAGKPPQYLQHLLLFLARTSSSRGHFSAAARTAPQPRFPFAPSVFRDGPVPPP
jgi:hypothetical protein